ncbi:MAG: hypothetical protein J1E34_06945 [Oscillospiraceae bacterium]|nr:hypothetical protein [Oscillospiraceae bacterium]
MKFKGSLNFLSAKKIIALFSCGAAAFLGLRAYQAFALLDPESGFFTDRGNLTVKLFFLLAAALVIITPLLLYLTPLSKAEYIEPKEHFFHGLISLGLGLTAGYNSFELMRSSGAEKTVLPLMISGAAAGIVFIIDAVGFFSKGKIVQKLKILNLIPVIWALFLTINNFTLTTSYLNNTALLINIFADAFLMIFLFQYAKKFSGIYGDANSPSFIYFALMSALLEISSFISSLISVLAKGSSASFFAITPYRLFAAAFCVSALAIMLKNKVPDYAPDSNEEEIKTAPFDLPSDEGETEEENEA